MNDLVRLAMERAVHAFDRTHKNHVFNAACFSAEFCRLAEVSNNLDGKLVRAILAGRPDVEVLHGGAHYRLVTHT